MTDALYYLKHFGSYSNIIDAAVHNSLENKIKKNHAYRLQLPFDLSNRYLLDKVKDKPYVDCSAKAIKYLRHSMKGLKKEHFKVIYLNGRNQVLKCNDIHIGTVNKAVIYPREIIKSAINCNAVSMIFAHNHVSGNPKPSQNDIFITKRLKELTSLLEMQVYDHIIIGSQGYFSFADNGMISES